jgi:hypothetical protein
LRPDASEELADGRRLGAGAHDGQAIIVAIARARSNQMNRKQKQ